MPVVQLPKERHTVIDNGYSLSISIPSRKNIFSMIFLGLWLMGWAFGEFTVGGIIIKGILSFLFGSSEISKAGASGLSGAGLFMIAWLAFWTVGGGFALYAFFWQLSGKENIEVSYDSVKIRRTILGYGKVNEYTSSQIKGLRISPVASDNNMFGRSSVSSFWGLSGGFLVFDYGSKTFRIGGGVDEAEARQILEKIVTRFPQYRYQVQQ